MNKRGPKHIPVKTIQQIRSLYESEQLTQQQLAAKFNLSQSTVCKIINNYIHKNIPALKISGNADVKFKAHYHHGN